VSKAVELTERLLATGARHPGKKVCEDIAASAETLFSALWRPLHDEADARAARAKSGLATRARKEADELRVLLKRRRNDLRHSLQELRQGDLLADTSDAVPRRRNSSVSSAWISRR
jgi:hypothetical protein